MSRLHAVMASVEEIAGHFDAEPTDALRPPYEVIEGIPNLIVIEAKGRRVMRPATWGFPRLTRDMRDRGDPPGRIGLVADLTNPMWDQLVVEPRYRCLIPLTHFANPHGPAGEMTRTWFSVQGEPIACWAGFCRNTPEFGPVYAGMTMDANAAVMPTNDRMPVLLEPDEYDRWLHGSIQDVIGFQFRQPLPEYRMTVLSTDDRWRSGELPPMGEQLGLL
jgi:putative SOS response-associated peptidase YedK